MYNTYTGRPAKENGLPSPYACDHTLLWLKISHSAGSADEWDDVWQVASISIISFVILNCKCIPEIKAYQRLDAHGINWIKLVYEHIYRAQTGKV